MTLVVRSPAAATFAAGLAATALAAAAAGAHAGPTVVPRQFYGNSGGLCEAALPAYDATLRKRPLAVQNEGTTEAFLTCNFISQGREYASVDNPTWLMAWFSARDGVAREIRCTLVTGFGTGNNTYIAKAATLAADGTLRPLGWSGGDFGDGSVAQMPSGAISLSCMLPPGVAMHDHKLVFGERVD